MSAINDYIRANIFNKRGDYVEPSPVGEYDYNNAHFLFPGNSNFTSQGGDNSTSVPAEVMANLAALGYTGITATTNIAIGGQTTQQMISAFSTQITPNIAAGRLNVVVFWEGINYGYYSATTKEDIVEKLETYADMLKAAGAAAGVEMLVINVTPGPRWVAGSIPSGYTSQEFSDLIDSTYPLILASSGHWHALADVRLRSEIYPRHQATVTIYHDDDGSHYKSPGKVVIADVITDKLQELAAPLPKLSTPALSVVAGDAQNVITFGASTSATSYTFQRATNSGFTTGVVNLNTAYPGATSPLNDVGLTNGTTYYYKRIAHASGYQDSNPATANATPQAAVVVDTTAPTITGAQTTSANTIAFTFSEAVTGTAAGFAIFDNGVAMTISGRAGNVFTVTGTLQYGHNYTFTYDAGPGDTQDTASTPNQLASIAIPQSITNNIIAAGEGIAPTALTGVTKVMWGSMAAANNTYSGSTVTQVTDQFGNGYHLTPASTAPGYSDTGGWNNKRYASLSSSATLRNLSIPVSQPFTAYLVCKVLTGVDVANLGGSTAISIFASDFDNGGSPDYSYTIGMNGGTTMFNKKTNLYDIGVQNHNVYKFHFEGAKSYVQRNRMPKTSLFDDGGGTAGMTALTLNLTGEFYEVIVLGGDVSAAQEPGLYTWFDASYPMNTHSNYAYFLGDSITVGVGTTNERNRYAVKLATNRGYYFNSAAVTGASLHHALGNFTKGLDSQVLNAIGLANTGRIFICIGTNNDYNKTGNGFNSTTQAQWVSDFDGMLDQLIGAGVTPSKIFGITPPYNKYVDGSGMAYYGTQADMTAFAAKQVERYTAKGCTVVDLFTKSKTEVTATTWSGDMPDQIHCGDAYNNDIFTYVNTFI